MVSAIQSVAPVSGEMSGKLVCVTGGSRGIGQAIVTAFADAGAKVVFTYLGAQSAAQELTAQLGERGGHAVGYRVDVRDEAETDGFFAMLEAEHGRLDVLVNNAGVIRDGLTATMAEDDWSTVVATNLTGAFHCVRPAVRAMLRQRGGAIINVSSVAATHPGRGHANYAASKGGIEALTRALAVELGGKGIRVNAVAPGMIETDMSKAVMQLAGDEVLARIPMKRLGLPREVAAAVLFLASPRASYVSGAILPVNGGIV
jgi:3-oxoacyl-[acyl-carrier protein] reductase